MGGNLGGLSRGLGERLRKKEGKRKHDQHLTGREKKVKETVNIIKLQASRE